MLRYLSDAFWARPVVPLLRFLPINALAVAGIAAAGFVEHAIWFSGFGFEALYLFVLASNPQFRQLVDAAHDTLREHSADPAQTDLLQTLGTPARQRVAKLEEKCRQIDRVYRESHVEDYLHESNVDALRKLTALYVDLLVAQRNIHITTGGSNLRDLQAQRDLLLRELADPAIGPPLRDSKQATLTLVQQRLANLARRDETLTQIDGDLARVEAQVDLAVENATLRGQPAAISSNIDLVSQLIGHDWDPTRFSITAGTDLAPLHDTTTTAVPVRETER